MPEPSEEVLSAEIAAGFIGAITLDTNIFDGYGDDLRHKILLSLRQFNGTNIELLFSDVVATEVKAHIAKQAGDSVAAVLKELKNHRQVWRCVESTSELGSSAHLTHDPKEFADEQWRTFAEATQATILVARDLVRIDELMNRYFSGAPPFAKEGKKKAEFPDAIALLSLEQWAKDHGKKILVISNDADWQSFADASDYLFCLKETPKALDHFNREAQFIAQRTFAFLLAARTSDSWNEIESAVELFVDDNSWEIEISASAYDPQATMQGGVLQHWQPKSAPLVIASNDDEIVFAVDLECILSFEASLDWYIYADGDWHSVGHSTNATTEDTHVLQFAFTCSRKIETEPEVNEVVVASQPFTVDFGYVDPGWDYEE